MIRRLLPLSGPARAAASVALALATAACGALAPVPVETPVLHVLDAMPAVAAPAPMRPRVLEVGAPRAAPGFDTTAIAYVQKPSTLDYFAVHRWVESPAKMLGPLLVRALEATGAFKAVVRGAAGVSTDLRLDTEVVRLQQSFLTRPSRVELTLRVQLVDVGARQVVATRVVEVVRNAPSDDPVGGSLAANAALASALKEVAVFCVTASATIAPRSGPFVGAPAWRPEGAGVGAGSAR
jgi:cholesterol transport system auxiliary component